MQFGGFFSRFFSSRVLVFADFIDPFCYIGFHTAQQACEHAGVGLEWRGFEINPATPADGFTLETGANSDLRPGMWASVEAFGRQAGLQLRPPERVPNTFKAQQLAYLSQRIDVKNPLIARIYRAYFNEMLDIGRDDVLERLADDCHLPKKEARQVLEGRLKPADLEKAREEAKSRQFAGLPGFVWKGRTFFGALSAEAWADRLNPNTKENRVHV